MAVSYLFPPKSPIQGRTEQGLGLEKAIFETTGVIRRASLDVNAKIEQKQDRKSPVTC